MKTIKSQQTPPGGSDDRLVRRLIKLHAGRSWIRLTIYMVALLILAPISITFELLRDFCESAAEWLNNLGIPLKKWAYFRKPNAIVVAPATLEPESKNDVVAG